jgi:hypothetical protein
MFEPLKHLLGEHSDRLASELGRLRDTVRQNTEAQIERTQSARKSVPVGKETTAELRNDSGYGWRLKWIAATAETDLFIGVNSDEAFMLRLKAREGKEMDWYLPPGGIVFVKNLSGEAGFANFEIDVLETTPVEGFTGTSEEHIDVPRHEPVPSGSPLDEPVAPPHVRTQ